MSLATASILVELILVALLLAAREVWRRQGLRAERLGPADAADPSGAQAPRPVRAEPMDLMPALFVDTCADWALRDEPGASPVPAPLVLDTGWRLVLSPDDEAPPAPAPVASLPPALSCTIARSAQERA
jgi:hypothetical protein